MRTENDKNQVEPEVTARHARAAYEAHLAYWNYPSARPPEWGDLHIRARLAWHAVAEAVLGLEENPREALAAALRPLRKEHDKHTTPALMDPHCPFCNGVIT
jgi:hypothetical protein